MHIRVKSQSLSRFLAALAALALAALPTVALAETTVTVTKFKQSYPYSGRATVEYTVGGTLHATAFAEITISTDDASATFVQPNIVAGANSHVIDFASSFGGALVLTNASFVVRINLGDNDLGGVQLWENGPYWAECNVGATEPEECGYYFWWGETVGYTRSGGTWDERTSRFYGVTWVSSTGVQMDSSPFLPITSFSFSRKERKEHKVILIYIPAHSAGGGLHGKNTRSVSGGIGPIGVSIRPSTALG